MCTLSFTVKKKIKIESEKLELVYVVTNVAFSARRYDQVQVKIQFWWDLLIQRTACVFW